MASGLVCRANRPNTWLHRPACKREEKPCQLGAVHTWHKAWRTDKDAKALCPRAIIGWVENPMRSSPAVLSRVLVLRLPAIGAFGNEIQEVPDAAEIVARREWRVGHPHGSP